MQSYSNKDGSRRVQFSVYLDWDVWCKMDGMRARWEAEHGLKFKVARYACSAVSRKVSEDYNRLMKGVDA